MKTPASAKRTPFPRAAAYTKQFVKGWEQLSRAGRYDMRQLKEAMLLLIARVCCDLIDSFGIPKRWRV